MKKIFLIPVLILAITVIGCSNRTPPECDNKKVIESVLEFVKQSIQYGYGSDFKFDVANKAKHGFESGLYDINIDEKFGFYACTAKLTARDIRTGDQVILPIAYTVKKNEDSRLYVTVKYLKQENVLEKEEPKEEIDGW